MFCLEDSFVDQLSDLTAHDLGNLATLTPENIGDFFLTLCAVNAHIKSKVLIDQKLNVLTLLGAQVVEAFRAFIHGYVCKRIFYFLSPGHVFLRKLYCFLGIVLKID